MGAVKPSGALAAGLLALVWSGGARPEGIEWDGFLQSQAAGRLGNVACLETTECDVPAAELRGQLNAESRNGPGSMAFLGRFDLVRDIALEDTQAETRELYGDWIAAKATARLGRQVITWGVADLLFINDSFPKDWVAFFTGQPIEYLKLGSDALKLSAYPGSVNLELVLADFRPDNLPTARRFVFPDPLPPGLARHTVEPGHDADELEASARVSGYLDNWEWAGYASRTHYRGPAWRVTGSEIVGRYPRLNTLGASLAGPVASGVLSLEAGYYDSVNDRSGTDPAVENSQYRGLAGYSQQLWEDATLGAQLYGELMRNHGAYRATLPPGSPARDRLRSVATLRLTQFFAHQTLTFNLFAFVGLSEQDRYLIPSLRYAFSDALWVEGGANLFGGRRDGMFGALQDNCNAYVTIRYAVD